MTHVARQQSLANGLNNLPGLDKQVSSLGHGSK